MALRASIPLMICLAAAGTAAVGLARPAADGQAATTDAYGQAVTADAYGAAAQSQPAAGGGEGAALGPASLTIADFDFEDGLVVAPGQAVQVINSDGAPHTVTAADGGSSLFDTGSIAGGGSASFIAPTAPGTYAFFCQIHPSMTGTLVVDG